MILRIHASSKKAGDEELFAELQLFTNWRYEDIKNWRSSTSNLVDAFHNKHNDILTARSKIYPFSMKELIEEIEA